MEIGNYGRPNVSEIEAVVDQLRLDNFCLMGFFGRPAYTVL